MDTVYTVKEAAAMLKVSSHFIYRLCERGELPHRKFGNRIRITEIALREYSDKSEAVIRPVEKPIPRRYVSKHINMGT